MCKKNIDSLSTSSSLFLFDNLKNAMAILGNIYNLICLDLARKGKCCKKCLQKSDFRKLKPQAVRGEKCPFINEIADRILSHIGSCIKDIVGKDV